MRELRLRLAAGAARTIGVHVGAGALDRLVDHLATRGTGRVAVIVSDDHVAPLYGTKLRRALARRGVRAALLAVPAGESSKTRSSKAALEDSLASLGVGGDARIVALGGGVVGDLAGFLAATWHRGVPLVQAPTSLLAMADAAVGGKTGVDLPGGKNLVGAYHQPEAVFADVSVLRTLPDAELVRGLAEVVKAAVVGDAGLFRGLERSMAAVRARDPEALERAVIGSLRVKARLVAADERDAGPRAALNFGHTAGHAIEAASRYRLSHGEAVAIGMVVESRIARVRVGFPASDSDRLRALLDSAGLPTSLPRGSRSAALLAAARLDKKNRDGRIRCALPARIGAMPGRPDPTVAVSEAEFVRALAEPDRRSRR